MQSLAYVSTSWSTPCTSVWIGSELHLRQTEPIPRFGGFYTYNVSVYHRIFLSVYVMMICTNIIFKVLQNHYTK